VQSDLDGNKEAKAESLPICSRMDLNRAVERCTLVIGYGNLDRSDDGVAYRIVNALRQRLGQKPLGDDATGLEELGARIDSVFLTQVGPELLETIAGYDQIIFVDAHVLPENTGLYCAPVVPEYTQSTFTHHMTPATLLALEKAMYQRDLAGFMVSVRGSNFDFGRTLSATTEGLVEPAVQKILRLI
jgi:hydrogenase maturation protease